jgi:ribosomal protein S6
MEENVKTELNIEEEKDVQGGLYEFAFMLRLGESEEELALMLEKAGVEIVEKNAINETVLAYPIKKTKSAKFGFYKLKINNPEAIAEITSILKLKDFSLRSIFVKIVKERGRKKKEVINKKKKSEEKVTVFPETDRIDNLTNEKLEETLEQILK